MSDLVLHPESKRQIEAFAARPSHALRILGPAGSGKLALARALAARLLGVEISALASYPYLLTTSSEGGKAIGIDQVRELEAFVARRIPGQRAIRRMIIIDSAHLLTPEAQNALLKTLEEPPADTVLLLLSSDDQALLPTIRSRTQRLNVRRPPVVEVEAYFTARGHARNDIQKALGMSGGLPGLMHALLTAEDDHHLKTAAEAVRKLLAASPYDRLLMVDELSRQRSLCEDICFLLLQLADLQLVSAAGAAGKRWQNILERAYHARDALNHSGQPKLVMTDLLLNL